MLACGAGAAGYVYYRYRSSVQAELERDRLTALIARHREAAKAVYDSNVAQGRVQQVTVASSASAEVVADVTNAALDEADAATDGSSCPVVFMPETGMDCA